MSFVFIKLRMHIGKFFAKHEHFLRRQRLKADDRREQIARAWPREFSFRKTRTQRLIAVDSATFVFHSLRRRPHYDAKVTCLSLQCVVVHGKHLLVVVLTCYCIWNLEDIDQFINH